jgi:hypothetical protein
MTKAQHQSEGQEKKKMGRKLTPKDLESTDGELFILKKLQKAQNTFWFGLVFETGACYIA